MKSLIDIMGVATMKDNIFLMTQISVANFLYVVKNIMENSNNQRSLAITVSNLLGLLLGIFGSFWLSVLLLHAFRQNLQKG